MRTRHILTAAVVTSLHFDSYLASTVYAADVSWSNGAAAPSQNRWTVDTNWLNNLQPGSSDRAIIATGSGTRIQIRNGSSATANVGSIQINTAESAYSILNADGNGSDAASINFGTGSTTFTSRFDLDMSSGTDFVVGDDPAAIGGTLTLSNVGTLEVRVRDGQSLQFQSMMIGTGSLILSRLGSLVSDSTVRFGNIGEGRAVENSTFSGGVRVDSGVLSLEVSSLPSSGAITSGPIGTGTLTMNGGSLKIEETGSEMLLGNYVSLNSDTTVTGGSSLRLNNTLNLGSSRILTRGDTNGLIFDNTTFAGSGDIRPGDGFADFDIGSSTSRTLSGNVGVGTSTVTGIVNKIGSGTFTANHFRVSELNVSTGTLVVAVAGSTFAGSTSGTSRINTFTLAGGSIATATLDVTNNDLIIDYSGTSPLNSGTVSDMVKQLASGRNNGSWNGNGIVSATARANSATLGIGYGEASTVYSIGGSGTATFSDQTVDATTVVVKFTVLGDANLDGDNDISDYGMVNPNFNTAQLWTGGDFNYDGVYNISDFSIQATNFNAYTGSGNQLRSARRLKADLDLVGVDDLTEDDLLSMSGEIDLARLPLFIAIHDNPYIYWEAHDRSDIWRLFEAYESLELGLIPPERPVGGRAAVPEPATFGAAVVFVWPLIQRRKRDTLR